jgi:hypothetical protein
MKNIITNVLGICLGILAISFIIIGIIDAILYLLVN